MSLCLVLVSIYSVSVTATRPSSFPTLPTRHPPIIHSGADPPDPASVLFPTRQTSARLILFVAATRPAPNHYHYHFATAATTPITTYSVPSTHTTHHRPPRPSSSVQPHRTASRPSIRSSTCRPFACGFFVFPRLCRILAHNGIQGETVALPLVLLSPFRPAHGRRKRNTSQPPRLSHCLSPTAMTNCPPYSTRALGRFASSRTASRPSLLTCLAF